MSRRYRKSVFQVQSSSSSPTGFFTAPTSVVAHSSPSPPSPSPPSPSPAHYIPPAPSAVPDSDTFVRETRRYRDLDASRSRSANASVSTSPPSHDDHSWESLSYSTHAATPDPGSSQPHTSPTASGTTIPGEPSMTRVTDVVDAQPPATIHTSRADGDERRQSAAPSLEQAQSQPSSRASSANAGLLSVGHFVPQAKSLLPRLPTPESEKPLHPPLYPEVSPPTPPPGWTFPPPPPPPAEGSGGAPPVGAWFSPVDFPDFASGDIPMPGADGSPDPAHFYFSSGPGFETDDKWARLRDIASRAVSPGSAGLRVDIVDLDQMASPVERQGQKTPYRGRGRRRKSRATLSGSPESKSPNGEARARSGEVRVTFEDGTAPGNPGIAPSPARSENPPSIPRPELKHARSKSLSPPRSPAMHNTSRQPLVAPSTPKRSRSPSPAQSSLTAPKSTSDSPEPSPPSIPSTPSLQNEDINAPSAKNSPQSSGQPQVTDLLPTSPSSPHDLPAADAHLTTPHRAFVGPCQWTELQRNVRDAAVKLDGPEAAFLDDVQPEIVVLGSDDSLRARLVEALVGVRLDVTPDHRRPDISWTVNLPGAPELNLVAAVRFVQDAIVAGTYGSFVTVPLHVGRTPRGTPYSSPITPEFTDRANPSYIVYEAGFASASATRVKNASVVLRLPGSCMLAMDRAKIIDVDLSEHELTDRMLRHLLRDLDDKVARDLSSRIQPVISHFRSQIAHLSSHAKHAKSQSSIPTAVRLQRFCEAVGRAGLARGITSSLEDVLRGQIDTVSPAFMFHLPDAPAPIAAPPPVPVKSAPLSPIRPTKPQSPPRTPVPGPSRTPMVWDWDRDVSPPRLVQVPFRRKDSSRSSSHGSHNSRPDSPSSRSRLRREPSPTPVASRVLHVRPPSVASMRPTRAHSPPVPRYMTPFGDLDEDVDTEQAITREDVIRRLQSARTDELPDEFNTKDVAREIMLEHIQQWEQPVLAYLDAVREKIMRDVGDLLSEHFGALVGMRLGVSKLVRARVTEATYYARAQLCQLLKTEQQPSVGDKTVYLALVHKHRHAVRDALQGANVEALPHEAMEQAAAEDVVARVMAYFEVAQPRLVETATRLVNTHLVRAISEPAALFTTLSAKEISPAKSDVEELDMERRQVQRRLETVREVVLDLECATALA